MRNSQLLFAAAFLLCGCCVNPTIDFRPEVTVGPVSAIEAKIGEVHLQQGITLAAKGAQTRLVKALREKSVLADAQAAVYYETVDVRRKAAPHRSARWTYEWRWFCLLTLKLARPVKETEVRELIEDALSAAGIEVRQSPIPWDIYKAEDGTCAVELEVEIGSENQTAIPGNGKNRGENTER